MSERVLVAPNASRNGRSYHTDEDCRRLPENPTEWDRETAEEWGFHHCKVCTGEHDPGAQHQDRSYQDALKAAAEADD